jgi:capsule assembly protein Wzi
VCKGTLECALATALLICAAPQSQSQSVCDPAPVPILVGSEWEQYLRVVQVAGRATLTPWSLRDFGPRQWDDLTPGDTALPWATPPGFSKTRCAYGWRVTVLPPHAQLIYNSAFPLGENDGPIWAGRGFTAAAEGGVSARFGALTLTFAPLVFSAENAKFRLEPNGRTGKLAFADWQNPSRIDLPQRFGDGSYSAFDLGQSSAQIDVRGVAIGVSTANQYWGPANDHPIILGNNAAGFPHLFAGSSRPLKIWRLGRAHGRVFWGKLDESPYSPFAETAVARLGSGIAIVFQPNAIRGLEIGGGRFFHVLQDRFRLDEGELLRPLGALLKVARARQIGSITGDEPDNQLSSVFARLVLPSDGVELYAEYGREDSNYDLRDLLLMPDHDAAYLLGLRKTWLRTGAILSLRAEVLNSRVSHLALASSQVPWYIHATVHQGHTNKGQVLGSAAAYGGGASVVALERYDTRGRWRVSWERLQLAESRQQSQAPDLFKNDVAHVLGTSVLRFGSRADFEWSVAAVYELNRYLDHDAFSLRTTLGVYPTALLRRPK